MSVIESPMLEFAMPPEVVTAANVDLASCDREQVQFPEAIQPHGVMLTVHEATNLILHASANCANLLGKAPHEIIGRTAASVLGRGGHDLLTPLRHMALDSGPVHVARESFLGSHGAFHLFAHRSGGLIVLELEAAAPSAGTPARLYSDLRADIAKLQSTPSLAAFFDLAVQRIRDFTGYDRVMAYKFDEDGSGEVVAEALGAGLESYLGLHYPASDIPAPARRLFSLAWVRHLPDVDYAPVPLIAAASPLVSGPVDLSFAALRSVSVMYTDYLRNMGVRSSMVMPLMKEGRLWGLVSAMHHAGPRHIPHETRMAAEFLAHTLSLLMSAKEDAETFARTLKLRSDAERLIPMLANGDFASHLPALLALIEANGVAYVDGEDVALHGQTPPRAEARALAHRLAAEPGPVVATDRIARLHPPAAAYAATAAGALAALLGPRGALVWFRPEQVAQVNWAGDPQKPVEAIEADGTLRLRPRGSFALWRESVRGRSTPWREPEKDAAAKLAEALRKSAPEGGLDEAAAAELKARLHGLRHLAGQLFRRHGEAFDAESRRQAAAILRLADRIDSLADALIPPARLESLDLDEIVDGVPPPRPTLRRPARLGHVKADRAALREVFEILIENAAARAKGVIEIGVEPGRPTRYFVADDGPAIAEADREAVFAPFRGLGGEAAGMGLAFARKLIERHGGRLWAEAAPGAGAIFRFTLEG